MHLLESIGITHPLIVAPMAGGPSSPALVAAASQAGVLGSVGAAYMNAAEIEAFVQEVRSLTQMPIAINLFIPAGKVTVSELQIAKASAAQISFRDKLGLPVPILEPPYEESFEEQFEVVLRLKPRVLSFVFGLMRGAHIERARKAGIIVIGTATTLDEALSLEKSGVDAIVLQGVEAGGHRAIFDATANDPGIKMLDLLMECVRVIKVPLIAAGGIMNAADIQNALVRGATAVQMGTAFLACKEAGTSKPYREAVLSDHRETKLTRAFSGRFARGIVNPFMTAIDAKPESILPFPAQNALTRDIRNASAMKASRDCMSLWSGSGAGQLSTVPIADLIAKLFTN